MIVPLLLAAAALTQSPTPVSASEAAARIVAACKLHASDISPSNDATLQEEVLVIRAAALDDAALGCLVTLSYQTDYFIVFDDAALQDRYRRIQATVTKPLEQQQAARRLTRSGLIGKLPHREPGEALSRFATRLERACTIPEGSMLKADGDFLALRPEAFQGAPDGTKLSCVMDMATLADVPVGFAGNAAVR